VFHAPFIRDIHQVDLKIKQNNEDILCKPTYVLEISPNFGKGEEVAVKPGQNVEWSKIF